MNTLDLVKNKNLIIILKTNRIVEYISTESPTLNKRRHRRGSYPTYLTQAI